MPAGRRTALGTAGEEAAAAWYCSAGYQILARNWRCREGELDLVVRQGPILVFCEVKTRTTDRFGTPAEAVTPAKQRRLRRLATRWLQEADPRPRPGVIRFDVAAVRGSLVEVIPAAF